MQGSFLSGETCQLCTALSRSNACLKTLEHQGNSGNRILKLEFIGNLGMEALFRWISHCPDNHVPDNHKHLIISQLKLYLKKKTKKKQLTLHEVLLSSVSNSGQLLLLLRASGLPKTSEAYAVPLFYVFCKCPRCSFSTKIYIRSFSHSYFWVSELSVQINTY